MAALHGTVGLVVLVVLALFAIIAAGAAWLDRWPALILSLRWVVGALLVAQVALGALVYLSGARPSDGLHLLYGLAILAVLPVASSFAADAPSRSRSGVMAAAGLIGVLLAWRLLSTG